MAHGSKTKVTRLRYSQGVNQGCQVAYFKTKNTNLFKFCKALQWMMLVYFMDSWSILWPFGIFLPFWYVVPRKIWQPRHLCSVAHNRGSYLQVGSSAGLPDGLFSNQKSQFG
jgi:hypothetical protein